MKLVFLEEKYQLVRCAARARLSDANQNATKSIDSRQNLPNWVPPVWFLQRIQLRLHRRVDSYLIKNFITLTTKFPPWSKIPIRRFTHLITSTGAAHTQSQSSERNVGDHHLELLLEKNQDLFVEKEQNLSTVIPLDAVAMKKHNPYS